MHTTKLKNLRIPSAHIRVLMIHGTGGGFDQGPAFAESIITRGHRVIAPSRFGRLRSDFPNDPSSEHQPDAFVDLLDRLGRCCVTPRDQCAWQNTSHHL